MSILNKLFVSMAFLTRLPIPEEWQGEKKLSQATFFFPIAGFLVGLLSFAVALVFQRMFGFHAGFIAAFLFPLLLTGGLHLDGLADSADGLFYAGSRIRRLEIMRDSQLGTYGVLALVIDLLLRFYGTYLLWQSPSCRWLIVVMPFVGKLGALFVLGYGKSPTSEGNISAGIADSTTVNEAWLWTLFFVFFCFFSPVFGSWLLFVPIVFFVTVWAYKKIDAASGDLCGFVNEVWETTFLLSIVITFPNDIMIV